MTASTEVSTKPRQGQLSSSGLVSPGPWAAPRRQVTDCHRTESHWQLTGRIDPFSRDGLRMVSYRSEKTWKRTYSMPKPSRQKPIEILTPDEVWALIRTCSRRAPSGRRDACLIALCAFAGLRTAEALQLLPSQVRRNEDGGVEICDFLGKGGKRRSASVIPGGEQPILDWVEARKSLDLPARLSKGGKRYSTPLLCSISNGSKGKALNPRNVRAMIKRRAQRAGVEKRVHLHGLRHFHAFLLAHKGVKLHVVQRQLGHERLDTTSAYIGHLTAKDIGEEIRRAFVKDSA